MYNETRNKQMQGDTLQPTTVCPVINEINFSRIMTMRNQVVNCHIYGIRTFLKPYVFKLPC